MAGVTWRKFYFRLFPGSIRSAQVVQFLRHLLRHIRGKVLVIWDGLRSHRSRMVSEFVMGTRGRLALEFLPLCSGTQPRRVSVGILEAA